MMTPKKPSRSTTSTVTTETTRLTEEEARVARLRRGVTVPDTAPLGLKHTETDVARAALLAIEREMVLKMRARTEVQTARKSKIVETLRGSTRKK